MALNLKLLHRLPLPSPSTDHGFQICSCGCPQDALEHHVLNCKHHSGCAFRAGMMFSKQNLDLWDLDKSRHRKNLDSLINLLAHPHNSALWSDTFAIGTSLLGLVMLLQKASVISLLALPCFSSPLLVDSTFLVQNQGHSDSIPFLPFSLYPHFPMLLYCIALFSVLPPPPYPPQPLSLL